ncbi:MAG: thioredoxin-disulfide reductase [Candidatus Desantisbacteria bacterium]
MYDVIIIGGGPAGLVAGLYAARCRLKNLLIENQALFSQAITTSYIENYPGFLEGISGFELIEKMKKQAEAFGLESVLGNVKAIEKQGERWLVQVEDRGYESQAVIVAVGASPKKLGLPGESEFCGKGVSYCATCDGPFFRDKDIVVVGGGDTALEEAIFLTKFASKVSIVHRRDKLRAAKLLQERAFSNERIEFVWNCQLTEIFGKGRVEGVRIKSGKKEEGTEAQRHRGTKEDRSWESGVGDGTNLLVKNLKNQQEVELSASGVFIFVGLTPNTDFLKAVLKLDEAGYIITDEEMRTSAEGIFACGDCRKKSLRQIITAAGDGATASFSAQRYIEGLTKG